MAQSNKDNEAVQSVDGNRRTWKREAEITSIVGVVLGSPEGQALMEYLRSITLDTVARPGLDDASLRELEGARRLVKVLDFHFTNFREAKYVRSAEPEQRQHPGRRRQRD